MSSIFKKVRTIILETNKNSVIGRIKHLQVFENYIFILDANYPAKLFMFDTDGKFIRIIGDIGAGPSDYMYADDFTIDTQKKEIYLLYQHFRINKYKIDGTFIGTIRINRTSGKTMYSHYIQYYNGKIYTDVRRFMSENDEIENNYMLQEIDPETGKQIKCFMSVMENKGWSSSPYSSFSGCGFMSKLSDTPKYIEMFTDIISLNKDNVETFISLQSKDLVTYADIIKIKNSIEEEEPFKIGQLSRMNKLYKISNYAETKKHVFFNYIHGETTYCVLLDLQTKSVKIAYILNDLVYEKGKNFTVAPPNYVFSTSEGVYDCIDINNQFMNDFIERIKNGDVSPNLDKIDELRKLPEDSNPVLFYCSYD
jgi:hypothetical protein